MNITIIGFGEAGPVFGTAFRAAQMTVTAFDIKQHQQSTAEHQLAKTRELDIIAAGDIRAAVTDSELIISTVTASQAVAAAEQAASALKQGQYWLDLNSVSPQTKRKIGSIVATHGAELIEGVAMDTVPARGIDVPILLCGPAAAHWSGVLNNYGLNTRPISNDYGAASTTKMLRSVVIKGLESLFAESIEAAAQVNATTEVINSLQATYPGLDWHQLAGYQLSRSSIHATRRAEEMREVVAMLDNMQLPATMTKATVLKQQELADRQIGEGYTGQTIEDFVNAIERRESD